MSVDPYSTPDPLAPLLGFGDLKVWSVLVTILGDLAGADATSSRATIQGPDLSALITRLGITAAALRVALHRLRNEDWIVSQRVGRISHYMLSDHGRSETRKVQDRVYGRQNPQVSEWRLAVLPDGAEPLDQPHIALGQNAFLLPKSADAVVADAVLASVTTGALPDWVAKAALPHPCRRDYDDWLDILRHLPAPATLSRLDQYAMRILALHHWRRIVLRHSALADAIMPATWAGADCRKMMAQLLASLPRKSS